MVQQLHQRTVGDILITTEYPAVRVQPWVFVPKGKGASSQGGSQHSPWGDIPQGPNIAGIAGG